MLWLFWIWLDTLTDRRSNANFKLVGSLKVRCGAYYFNDNFVSRRLGKVFLKIYCRSYLWRASKLSLNFIPTFFCSCSANTIPPSTVAWGGIAYEKFLACFGGICPEQLEICPGKEKQRRKTRNLFIVLEKCWEKFMGPARGTYILLANEMLPSQQKYCWQFTKFCSFRSYYLTI